MEMLRDIELPSNGVFYPIKKVTIDAIGFEQEKKLFSSTADDVIDQVIQDCVVAPKGFDVNSLVSKDKEYILFQLRSLSYGSDYSVKVLDNGAYVEKEISIDDMECITLPEDYQTPVGTMPMCKDEVAIQVPTVGQMKKAREYAADKAEKLNQDFNDIYYEQSKALLIKSVNGEALDNASKIAWLKGLKGRDLAYFDHLTNKVNFGLTGKVPVTLSDGSNTEASVRITGRFFRPEFTD